MSSVLIIGSHPIKDNIRHQFGSIGMGILDNPTQQVECIDLAFNDVEEIVILSSPSHDDNVSVDNRSIAILNALEKDTTRKRTIHLMLQSRQTLWALQHNNLTEDVTRYFDVYPFVLMDEWTRQVIAEIALPHRPIDIRSNIHQHLVIFGTNDTAEYLAINAALAFHYPNYTRDHKLRSRITLVSRDMAEELPPFLHRYEHLFRHSHYRVIDLSRDDMVFVRHKPENLPEQEDYVDVEWEFVIGDSHDDKVRSKLSLWSSSHLSQNLVIAFASDNDEQNLSEAVSLPDNIYDNHIPVYVRQRHDTLSENTQATAKFSSIRYFGMVDKGYDVSLPLIRMGRIVNDVYDQCYNDNYNGNEQRADLYNAIEIDAEEAEMKWRRVKPVKRYSNIFNAMTVPVKLHSVGISKDEWAQCYDMQESVIQILAEVEHNRWNVEELILGFRPCNKKEQEKVEMDISMKEEYKRLGVHYDIRPYRDLRMDRTGRSANVYDIVLTRSLPLIAAEYMKEGGNG